MLWKVRWVRAQNRQRFGAAGDEVMLNLEHHPFLAHVSSYCTNPKPLSHCLALPHTFHTSPTLTGTSTVVCALVTAPAGITNVWWT